MAVEKGMPGELTTVDLYAFGPREIGPKFKTYAQAQGKDAIGPESLPFPDGGSAFSDPVRSLLKGSYHRLPGRTELPEELGVVADGVDVRLDSPHRPTHHTIYPKISLPLDAFLQLLQELPWLYAGRIR